MKHSQLRVIYSNIVLSSPITSPDDSYTFLLKIWDKSLLQLQEQVYVLYLNNANEVICWRCLHTGSSSETMFDVKLALAYALSCVASKVIIAHNHPSGKLQPSYSDIAFTNKLNKATEIMDIKLVDHIIITRFSYYSFKEHLLLKG